jgi:energy-coupling factor transport system permease protein
VRFAHGALDPRSKAAFLVAVALAATVLARLDVLAVLGVVLAVTVVAGRGLSVRAWLGSLAPFRYLIPLVLVLNTLFYAGGETLWGVSVAGVTVGVTTGGLLTSAVIASRLLVIAAAAAWFALTTEPAAFERALELVGVPWRVAFVFSLTLRLVPELRTRFRNIEDAQRSRGLRFEGGPLARARARIPTFVPFLASVIQYGYDLGDALAIRDFESTARRTSLIELEHGRADYGLYLAALGVLAATAAVALGTPLA